MSKIRRRSGNAVVEYCQLMDWKPDAVVLVGVGGRHDEVHVMKEAWPDIHLFGFEPHPKTYDKIIDLFPGKLYRKAVSNYSGYATLYCNMKLQDGLASLYPRESTGSKFSVNTVTLDDVSALKLSNEVRSGRKCLLWLDCEGSELDALKGGKLFIDGCVGVINVEMTGRPRDSGWPRPEEVHRWLVDRNFLQAWVHTTRSVRGQADCIYVRRELFKPDLCCCPGSIEDWRCVKG